MTKILELSVFLHPKQAKRSKKKGPAAPRGHGTHISHRANKATGKVPTTGTNVPTNGKEFTNNGTFIIKHPINTVFSLHSLILR